MFRVVKIITELPCQVNSAIAIIIKVRSCRLPESSKEYMCKTYSDGRKKINKHVPTVYGLAL